MVDINQFDWVGKKILRFPVPCPRTQYRDWHRLFHMLRITVGEKHMAYGSKYAWLAFDTHEQMMAFRQHVT